MVELQRKFEELTIEKNRNETNYRENLLTKDEKIQEMLLKIEKFESEKRKNSSKNSKTIDLEEENHNLNAKYEELKKEVIFPIIKSSFLVIFRILLSHKIKIYIKMEKILLREEINLNFIFTKSLNSYLNIY